MSCKVKSVACGGNGLFMITPSDANEVMCVAWGQGCVSSPRYECPNEDVH
jgi:hypothetical protein